MDFLLRPSIAEAVALATNLLVRCFNKYDLQHVGSIEEDHLGIQPLLSFYLMQWS